MANFGKLAAEIYWRVWGTQANFNRCHVLASLLQRRRSAEANETLHDVWSSAGLVHYIYTFEGSCPVREFCHMQNHFTSKSCVLLYWQRYCTALQQRASAKLCGVVRSRITELSQRAPPIFGGGHHDGHWPTFLVLPGSAEALFTWGGIVKRLLIAYFIGNISAQKYQNPFMCVKVIASQRWAVFWDTVYKMAQKNRAISHCESKKAPNSSQDSVGICWRCDVIFYGRRM